MWVDTICNMRGMEVHLNENKLCTAGIGPDAVLNAMVDIVGRNNDYDMMIRVGGLENDEFLVWSRQELRIGDEIRIRIVETKSIDAPVERKPNVST
jgi:hypothetical protein